MSAGSVGILNVGAGDIALSFDKSNPAEAIRAARIVKDLLRRGYALLIEVPDGQGGTTTTRVRDFREDIGAYIIADFDPIVAAQANAAEAAAAARTMADQATADEADAQSEQDEAGAASPASGPTAPPQPLLRRGGRRTKAVAADSVRGVAVARSAGG